MSFFKQNSLVILTQLLLAIFCVVESFKCPAIEEISPCFCSSRDTDLRTGCFGPEINQSHIDTLLTALRSANDAPPGQWLSLPIFQIWDTHMTSLDFAPFVGTRFDSLQITSNSQLVTIIPPDSPNSKSTFAGHSKLYIQRRQTGGKSNNRAEGIIEAADVEFGKSNLSDQGLGSILTYFVPDSIKVLFIWFNTNVQGSQTVDEEGFVELFPGFNEQTQIERLYLAGNNITSFSNGPFRKLRRLNWLSIHTNPVVEIGPNGFLVEEFDPDLANATLTIEMSILSQLENSHVHPDNGLGNIGRPVSVGFGYNSRYEVLSRENYEKFLLHANPLNDMILFETMLICDNRMKWIKDARDRLEQRLIFAACANDPGQTVFTTSLID